VKYVVLSLAEAIYGDATTAGVTVFPGFEQLEDFSA
jgi:hypothetical protein